MLLAIHFHCMMNTYGYLIYYASETKRREKHLRKSIEQTNDRQTTGSDFSFPSPVDERCVWEGAYLTCVMCSIRVMCIFFSIHFIRNVLWNWFKAWAFWHTTSIDLWFMLEVMILWKSLSNPTKVMSTRKKRTGKQVQRDVVITYIYIDIIEQL